MKSIGFKNFRKFVDFPTMEFSDITLMVGRNNSGKSTLVKAVLLVINYLKNYQNQSFPFTTGNINDVNIVSFDRARCKFQPDDKINFTCNISHYTVNIAVSGDKHSIVGIVDEIIIYDEKQQLTFSFNYNSKSITISKGKDDEDVFQAMATYRAKTAPILENQPLDEYLHEVDQYNKVKERKDEPKKVLEGQVSDIFSTSYELNLNRISCDNNFLDYIFDFLDENENEKRLLINQREKESLTDEQNEKLEEVNLVQEFSSELKNSISEFISAINNHHYYYWSAETQKQSALFSIRDNNSALAKAIHDFCSLNIQRGDNEYLFIENELRSFDIGESFELIPHAGEAYECNIIEETKCRISLADKGMGSIQIMTLLFRLASIIRQQNIHKENVTLIIEEPELNLHPSLQSKLLELFESVNIYHGVKFIIETHSEYIIRKTQVLVADKKYKDEEDLKNNIFSVYYFKSDGVPYQMSYRTDGKFSNKFGEGFFDEANNLIFEIL